MARKMRPIRPEQQAELPVQFGGEVELPCSPERLFESFKKAEDWPQWLGIRVTWLDEDYALGMRRTISGGPMVATELFTVWDPPRRMCFYFEDANLPIMRAFAEDWSVESLDDGRRCRLRWSGGLEMRPLFRWLGPMQGRTLSRNSEAAFQKLAALVSEPTTPSPSAPS